MAKERDLAKDVEIRDNEITLLNRRLKKAEEELKVKEDEINRLTESVRMEREKIKAQNARLEEVEKELKMRLDQVGQLQKCLDI